MIRSSSHRLVSTHLVNPALFTPSLPAFGVSQLLVAFLSFTPCTDLLYKRALPNRYNFTQRCIDALHCFAVSNSAICCLLKVGGRVVHEGGLSILFASFEEATNRIHATPLQILLVEFREGLLYSCVLAGIIFGRVAQAKMILYCLYSSGDKRRPCWR